MNDTYEPDLSELAEKMAELTCEIAKKCAEKEKHFAGFVNLTPAEFKCLRLFTSRNQIPVKEIAESMKITQGRVTHIITSLENKSLIIRKLDPVDKRNVIAYLTEKSEPFLKSVNSMYVKLHHEILQNMNPENRKLALEILEEVISALDTWIQQHPAPEQSILTD